MALFDMLKDGLNLNPGNMQNRRSPQGFDEESKKKLAMVAIPAILWAVHKAVQEDSAKQKELEDIATKNRKLDPNDMTRSIEEANPQEGKDILDKILGREKDTVTKSIAEKSNVSQEEVDAVLDKITPTIIEMLQKEKEDKGVSYDDQLREELNEMQKDPEIGGASSKAKEYIDDDKDHSLADGLMDILRKFIR